MALYSDVKASSVGRVASSGLIGSATDVTRYHDFSASSGNYPRGFSVVEKHATIRVSPVNTISADRERSNYYYHNTFFINPGKGAGNGIDILRFTTLDIADDAVPSSSEVYNRIMWECRGCGHSSAQGSGSRFQIGQIDFNGASPTNTTNTVNQTDGSAPIFTWTHSNYVSTLEVAGAGSGAGSQMMNVDVRIWFNRGAGSRGSFVYYKLEELV
jgi:hypothetical protein